MKRRLVVLAVCLAAPAACTETLIGPFISPTREMATLADLSSVGVSLSPRDEANPHAICASSYDREFAPWGEHYGAESWGFASAAFLASGLDREAIIDVDTSRNDFGHVLLVWTHDGRRLKLFLREQATGDLLFPDGCRIFDEVGGQLIPAR